MLVFVLLNFILISINDLYFGELAYSAVGRNQKMVVETFSKLVVSPVKGKSNGFSNKFFAIVFSTHSVLSVVFGFCELFSCKAYFH